MGNLLETEERQLKTPGLEGLYSERRKRDDLLYSKSAGLAYRQHLSQEEIDALIYECEEYLENGSLEDGRMFFFTPKYYERMNRRRIETLKRNILDKRPEWVREIKDVMRHEKQVYWIVNLSGVPPYPGVAIAEALIERGEHPEDVL
jgi:hypothetical protein